MNCEVDTPGAQRFFQLLDEKPLAADLGERPVGDLVAGGADDDAFDRARRRQFGMRRHQPLAQQLSLAQRELAAAGADAQSGGCHGMVIGFAAQQGKGRCWAGAPPLRFAHACARDRNQLR